MAQDEIAGVQGQAFKLCVITGQKKPVADLGAQQFNAANRGEVPAEAFAPGVDAFRQNQPDAVIPRVFQVISEHHEQTVAVIDSESGEHPSNFRIQWSEGF